MTYLLHFATTILYLQPFMQMFLSYKPTLHTTLFPSKDVTHPGNQPSTLQRYFCTSLWRILTGLQKFFLCWPLLNQLKKVSVSQNALHQKVVLWHLGWQHIRYTQQHVKNLLIKKNDNIPDTWYDLQCTNCHIKLWFYGLISFCTLSLILCCFSFKTSSTCILHLSYKQSLWVHWSLVMCRLFSCWHSANKADSADIYHLL